MEYPQGMPGKSSVLTFDILHKSGLVKMKEEVTVKKKVGQKPKVTFIPSTVCNDNDENIIDITLSNAMGKNCQDAPAVATFFPKRVQHQTLLSVPKTSMTPVPRNHVVKTLVNKKTVHTIVHGSRTSTPKPITYARELAVSTHCLYY